MKSTKAVLFFPTLFWVLIMTGTYIHDQVIIDSCLDKGGSFNYQTFTCDMENSHTIIPYFQARYPRYGGITIGYLIFFLGCYIVFKIKNQSINLKKHTDEPN